MKLLLTILLGSALSLLSGCSVLGDAKPVTTFVLQDVASVEPVEVMQPATLVIAPVNGNSFDDRDALVFANSDNTRGQYQFAQWSEKPSRRIDELLFSRLENAQVYQTIAPADGDVIAQHLLVSDLLDFYHDASRQPGLVKVSVRFTLYDQTQHKLLKRQTFEFKQALTTFDATGAAQAFNIAVSHILDEVVVWLSLNATPPSVSAK